MAKVTVTKCDQCGAELKNDALRRSLLGDVHHIHVTGQILAENTEKGAVELHAADQPGLDFCNDYCLKTWLRERRNEASEQGGSGLNEATVVQLLEETA
ncbi:hypothetical protein [Desulfohalobium retbaense]|uniref:Uncharacterized protein n=1 Tax=Desulfohalobium retbaense (strain ATCC 49708 / DSM 5692 / JCM 16813 / HR100) TaxID=485915 RepID=C8X3A2_DESRD|nr:hypothetical protein [Desulfohalobium retbaense]ACV68899.1 hypothetical protein Dret_1615 [Desulfohalobium retbaense DSM 5692]